MPRSKSISNWLITPKNLSFAPSPEIQRLFFIALLNQQFLYSTWGITKASPLPFFSMALPEEYRILSERHSSGTVMQSMPPRLQDSSRDLLLGVLCLSPSRLLPGVHISPPVGGSRGGGEEVRVGWEIGSGRPAAAITPRPEAPGKLTVWHQQMAYFHYVAPSSQACLWGRESAWKGWSDEWTNAVDPNLPVLEASTGRKKKERKKKSEETPTAKIAWQFRPSLLQSLESWNRSSTRVGHNGL